MSDFWKLICDNLGISSTTVLILLITFVQIAPIKINPWSVIIDYFSAPIRSLKKMEKICDDQKELHQKLDEVQTKLQFIDEIETQHELVMQSVSNTKLLEQSQKQIQNWMQTMSQQIDYLKDDREKDKAIASRIRILQFGDEITNNIYHSKEHYEQILKDIELYESFCNSHPSFPNNITVITSKVIKESYKKLLLNQIQQANNTQ